MAVLEVKLEVAVPGILIHSSHSLEVAVPGILIHSHSL